MRFHYYLLLLAITVPGVMANAQTSSKKRLLLKNASFAPEELSQKQVDEFAIKSTPIAGQRFGIIQFDQRPSANERGTLAKKGIVLLDYLPPNAYTASFTNAPKLTEMKLSGIRSITSIAPYFKLQPQLILKNQTASLNVLIAFYTSLPVDTVKGLLAGKGFAITNQDHAGIGLIQVTVPAGRINELASLAFVAYIEPAPVEPTLLNNNSRNFSFTNKLHSTLPGGYNLSGEGVVIGISEPSYSITYPHLDFRDRIIAGPTSLTADPHATHVLGTIAGAGNINERNKGYAPAAKIVSNNNGGFLHQASPDLISYVQSTGMVATNNSYAVGTPCDTIYGIYNFVFDRIPLNLPNFIEVYAAGNSGTIDCQTMGNSYPGGFHSVVSYANSAKNTLSVGALDHTGQTASGSSRGPGPGGRIKPDIITLGINVVSSVYAMNYASASGTSMSAPAATGGLALLNQLYRRLHNGEVPSSSLMKAVLCNSASDIGNRGPDFLAGFGSMNLLRAAGILDHYWHKEDSVSDQQEKTFTITVPPGAAQLKVLLYWHDAQTGILSYRPLVNDLDLTVANSSGQITLPYVLNSDPAHVGEPATRGVDRVNNIEQVVIDDPVAGDYTIKVKAAEIGDANRQLFSVVYDIIDDKVELGFPVGGEGLVPGEIISIKWNDQDRNTSTYTIEFSTDNGNNWQVIHGSLPGSYRQYAWTVPAVATPGAMIRIRRNQGGPSSSSSSFVIIGTPAVTLSPVQCPGYFSVKWNAVPGADDYEVMLLRNGKMESQAVTANLDFLLSGLQADSTYFISVRARVNTKPGTRSVAISRKPDNGSCAGSISDNDLQLAAILVSPLGRYQTSLAYKQQEPVKIRLRNLDDQPSGAYTVQYAVGNSNWITENFNSPVPANGTKEIILSTPYDFSATGNYELKVVVSSALDNNRSNDTAVLLMRHVGNLPLDLTVPFVDSFQTAARKDYTSSSLGLAGIERYDYAADAGVGLFSTGTSGVFASARKELYLLSTGASPAGLHHRVTGTFNLSAYDTALHNIGMIVGFSKTGVINGNEKIFIRGNDALPWVEAYVFGNSMGLVNNKWIVVDLSDVLRKSGQNFSPSFQVAADQELSVSRFSISAITLYNIGNDAELVSIDSLALRSCEANARPVRIKVRNNSRQPITDLHVFYSINNSVPREEVIPQIAPYATLNYTFAAPGDFSTLGMLQLKAWLNNPGDPYTANDRKDSILHNEPMINTFPYLEDFEKGDGYWYADGVNSSWAYGTPASPFIHEAASGKNVWKTNLNGSHNANEMSFLHSPCFDLSSLKYPKIAISLAKDIDYCFSVTGCDALTAQILLGSSWINLLAVPYNYNWDKSWGDDKSRRWKVSSAWLPKFNRVGLRFGLRSDGRTHLEGVAIDNIHIYDSLGVVYGGDQPEATTSKEINAGNQWQNFHVGDRIMAAVNSYQQDLGLTSITSFDHPAAPSFHGQYYLRRHLLLRTAKKTTDSIGVRLYFKDSDADSIFYAKNCANCTKPANAYRFGVSTYSSTVEAEYNNNIQDNMKGTWRFLNNANVRIIPYENGYYAEFKIKDVSELWLNDGGLDHTSILPMQFTAFDAKTQSAQQALLEWTTAAEINIHHFDIEVAKGNLAFDRNEFVKTGETQSGGLSAQPQSYSYTDDSDRKAGVYYYRLKAVDAFGNYSYSPVKPVYWSNEWPWQVFPNPSATGLYTLSYQAAPGEPVRLAVFNASGALIHQAQFVGNGFIQQSPLPLEKFSAGIYILRAETGKTQFSIKLVKK